MSDALHVYSLLQEACRSLDDSDDHAIAAYVGLSIALLEEKYGLKPENLGVADTMALPAMPAGFSGGNWA